MIIRKSYLNQIEGFIDKDLIKIISGTRRSGKSTLLRQIAHILEKELNQKTLF
ncbi:MAG: hypothetical protein LBD03_01090 [Methanobrevibacter sp.]|jgi:predicted AAA+ superfamily ATPase|nr:hypothetical protein [Candidatus Methanovirga procula]